MEFLEFVNRSGISIENIPKNRTKYVPNRSRQSLPLSIDWRNISGVSYVSPIKNQGKCGSCWAFSVVSVLESYYFKENGVLLNLSEQHLVDCAKYNMDGCNGGWMTQAYDYVNTFGISLANSYPYKSGSSGVVINLL